jgi:5-deoxy-glucuronate isomerase
MANLRLKPSGASGRVHNVTPENAGWTYVGFELHRLAAGERARGACPIARPAS